MLSAASRSCATNSLMWCRTVPACPRGPCARQSPSTVRITLPLVKAPYTKSPDLAGPTNSGYSDGDAPLVYRVAKARGIVVAPA